ncbi:MAG: nickel pincer cofactor biosynthesis protein LarC [Cyanobacteria bacterium P01_H01_bin.162]
MKTLAFLDCPTGISGDMCLGALVSAGVPLSYLQAQIDRLNLPETVKLTAAIARKNGIAATKVNVGLPHETTAQTPPPPLRHLHDIEHIITTADLPARAIAWSLAIFRRLAQAEGAIHGIEPQQVHFHEVGATDAIVDIVGTCLGLDWLNVDELHCAPLPTGRGTVRAAHGRLPVPAPAVLKLMEMAQAPIYNAGLAGELVTPTGAAIATELAAHFGEPPSFKLQKVGLGAGTKDLVLPNILRLWLGTPTTSASTPVHAAHHHAPSSTADSPTAHHHSHEHSAPETASSSDHTAVPPAESHDATAVPTAMLIHASESPPLSENIELRAGQEIVVVLETQVDDLSPQAIGYLYDRLLQSGALDVFTQSVTMKKSRLGHLISAIAYPETADDCEQILLQETTTLGVRRSLQQRLRLRRELRSLVTPLGPIRMKLAFAPGQDRPLKAHPEYEDCAALAQQHHLPWREVHNQALACWHTHITQSYES